MSRPVVFPQYRKYDNNKVFFRINSETHFVELNIMGSYYQLLDIHADRLPERNLISDILSRSSGHILGITAAEFEAAENECKKHRKLLMLD